MDNFKERLEAKNKQQFGRWAKCYDNFFYWIFFRKVYEKLIEVFENLVEIAASRTPRNDDKALGGALVIKVIDVACGTGEIIYRLAVKHPTFEFYGIDLTREMVLAAKNKNLENKNVVIQEGNAEALPWRDNEADVLICSDAFHHFSDANAAVKEFVRVLKIAGRVLIVDPPAKSGLKGKIFDFFGRIIDAYNKLYSREELIAIFSAAGFKIIKEEKFYFHNFFIFEKV